MDTARPSVNEVASWLGARVLLREPWNLERMTISIILILIVR